MPHFVVEDALALEAAVRCDIVLLALENVVLLESISGLETPFSTTDVFSPRRSREGRPSTCTEQRVVQSPLLMGLGS